MSCHERWTFQLSSIGTQLWEVWTTWLDDFSLNVYCKPSHFHVRGTFLLTKKNYDVIAEHEEVWYNLELYLSRHCTAFDIFVFRTWGGFHLRKLEGSMFNVCDTIARVAICAMLPMLPRMCGTCQVLAQLWLEMGPDLCWAAGAGAGSEIMPFLPFYLSCDVLSSGAGRAKLGKADADLRTSITRSLTPASTVRQKWCENSWLTQLWMRQRQRRR